MAVLEIKNISKNYKQVQALKNISFTVPEKSIYGILGPNGSGKTTLLGIVMNVLHAESGTYLWNGDISNAAQRKKIGTLLETPNFYHYLNGEKNLEIAAAIKGSDKNDIPRVLKIVNLYERRQSAFSSYSLGMKQRLAIASTLLGNPEVLVFDEPTNGLDPAGIAEIRQLIKKLHQEGKTIIMASHVLDEVEKICTHVTILQNGSLKTSGTVHEVLHVGMDSTVSEAITTIEIGASNLIVLLEVMKKMSGIHSADMIDNTILLTCNASILPQHINKYCFEQGITLSHIHIKKKSLESRFLEITGNTSDR